MMKKEIITVVSMFVLMVINTLFWYWFIWLWDIIPGDGIILLICMNAILMIFATAYFANKYD